MDLNNMLPCSGTIEPDSVGNRTLTVSAKYYEELHKKAGIEYKPINISGLELKLQLNNLDYQCGHRAPIDDQSFWRRWK